jgi:NitT/TauT family transport system substrate-binding protein
MRDIGACFIGLVAVLAVTAGASGAEPVPVRVAISNTSSDVGIFIADKKGYFRDEGIAVTTIPFDSAAKMVAPLGSGELDVGSGSAAAGLYSAVARGIKIEIVADTSSAPPHYGHNILLVRTDLMASGRYKTLADLKGMKIALTAPGASSNATLNVALVKAGIKFSDIEPVYLGYPQHYVALVNKAVDAGLTAEPAATQAINARAAVRIMSDDEIDPYHQAAVVLYSGAFAQQKPDAARRFMKAYLRAVRYYNGALADGKLAGPNGEDVIAILTEYTKIKDAAVYRAISPQGCNPDGYVNEASLKKDFAFYQEQGWIEGKVTVEQVIDNSFVAAALKDLGPYKASMR